MRTPIATVGLSLLLLSVGTSFAAMPQEECLIRKLAAIKRYGACQIHRQITEIRHGENDSTRCEEKLANTWSRAEDSRHGCVTVGDEAYMLALVERSIDAIMRLQPCPKARPSIRCGKAKLRATMRHHICLLNVELQEVTSENPPRPERCIQKFRVFGRIRG